MTQNQQRFSGRELAELLSQVRQELGERATIIEANKTREGGIGGFFSKERFEVVATNGEEPDAVLPASDGPHLDGLLSMAERVSIHERLAAAPAAPAAAEAADGGGEPVDDDLFVDILRGALGVEGPAVPAGGDVEPPIGAGGPTEPVEGPAAVPVAPCPQRPPAPEPAVAARPSGIPAEGFWAALERFEQLVEVAPLDAALTTVVGPLDDAVAVARHLARLGGVEHGDLVVVTDARTVDGVPPWQVVDRRDELVDRVRYWRANDRRAVVVIDLEDGERAVERCARTVEAAGADVTRLAVPDLDDPAHLAGVLRGLGRVAAIDVSRPPSPERLVDVVERGVRIGTVCGRPLTPMLLAGLAATIAPALPGPAGPRHG